MINYDHIHFGVDYYPEHWPEERWETDAKLMQEMGIQVVRMAEFSWHKMEPSEGKFDFEWLDRAIEILASYGIKSVLGTPTAAPPAWLVNKYPEILPVDRQGIVHGFGGRHHDCQSNPLYRKKVKTIVTKMASRFGENPNVIGWQIDNELGNSHFDFCHCDSCRKAFQTWLKIKYQNVDSLNKAWGTAFWSQEYNSFEEVFTPHVTAAGENPSQMLDWKCFHSDLIVGFATDQAEIIRKLSPGRFITHNYMGFSDLVSYYDLGKLLDFVSHDQYPSGYWLPGGQNSPAELASQLDVVRSFKNKPFWIMEQESGITGWGNMGRLPIPGQLSLWSLQSVAHGADAIVYFRWRACTMGTEQYWHAVLPHSGVPGKSYKELSEMIGKVAPIMDDIEGSMPESPVGIVYSYRQEYAFNIQPHTEGLSYINYIQQYYNALYDRNISVDFVPADGDLGKYKILFAPLQYLMNPELEDKYADYVRNGGKLILTMRTGVKDENNLCMTEQALPGRLSEVTGCHVYDYDCIGGVNVPVRMGQDTIGNATLWADLVIPDKGAETVAVYGEQFYKGTAAVTKHNYGEGICWYIGTQGDEDFISKIVDVITEDIEKTDFGAGVEITQRIGEKGKFTFVLNHTDREQSYQMINGELVYGDKAGCLGPFEVHIIKSQK